MCVSLLKTIVALSPHSNEGLQFDSQTDLGPFCVDFMSFLKVLQFSQYKNTHVYVVWRLRCEGVFPVL